VNKIVELGFLKDMVEEALKKALGDTTRAVEMLINGLIVSPQKETEKVDYPQGETNTDGQGEKDTAEKPKHNIKQKSN